MSEDLMAGMGRAVCE
jgi:activator of 2-hydroxyglutaryl-CoA dehydratase